MRVRGVVLARPATTELYVRGSDGAQCLHLFPPFARNTDREEFADAGLLPPLHPGDEVEVVGSAMTHAWELDARAHALLFCHVRVTGHRPPVEPVPATLAEIAAGKWTHDLVRVRGRLTGVSRVAVAKGERRTTLELDAGGIRIPVHVHDSGRTATDALNLDDELLVTALAGSARADHPPELWLVKGGDVVSLGLSPVVRARRLWLWGGSMSIVAALLGGWIAALRRASRRQARTARELRAAGDAARESEQRWQLLFEQSPLSVQIFAPDGRTMRVNRAWMNLFRQTEAEGLAFNVLEDPNLKAGGAVGLIRRAFAGEVVQVPPVPFPVNTDPPEHRWIGGVLYPVKSAAGEIIEVVTVHNDITEMKRAEEAMLALNHMLEHRVEERTAELSQAQAELSRALDQERELGELKSRFVYTVSHEFRTPLGVIMSAVELLQHYSDRLPQEEQDFQLAEIRGSTEHMGKLMEQVLLLGRVESGKLACQSRPLDLSSLADRIIDESRSGTGGKCRITLHAGDGFDRAQGDEALLRHILGNLIGNAIKYSPDEGEVVVDLRRDHRDAVIEIRDQGIGIPEADHSRLFETFHRGSNVGDTCGTGLGLAIVKHCVGLHGGEIGFRSSPGTGTTFTVRLPLFPPTP
jgi:PAS domain S-box-containing protein